MDSVPAIPLSLRNLVTYDKVLIRSTLSNSTSGISESNFGFSLNQHPQVSSWTALFDQWCIPQVSISFMSFMSPSSTGTLAELHTAVDFDNSTNLGSLASLDDYESAQVDLLAFNKVVTRSVKPCIKPDTSGASGNAVARSWIDSAFPGTLHFGIRAILAQAATNATTLDVVQTIWFAFRNPI
jgi:hypothetical protein